MSKLSVLKNNETISSAFKKIKGKFGQTLFIVDGKKKFFRNYFRRGLKKKHS